MAGAQECRELGVCRCCLSEGTYKSMELQYLWAGKLENYTDMLRDAFDITLMRVNTSSLICSMCVMRLRDAFAFRLQVHNAERTFFQRSVGHAAVQIKIELFEPDVTEEPPASVKKDDEDVQIKIELFKPDGTEEPPASVKKDDDDPAHSDSEDDAPLNTIPPARRPARPTSLLAETPGQLENGTQECVLNTTTEKPKSRRYEQECEICEQTLETITALRKHMRDSHPSQELNYKCPECPAVFVRATTKLKHVNNSHGYTGEEFFTCKECDARFPTNHNRYLHMKEAHGYRKKLLCPKCPELLKTYYRKLKHLKKVHGVEIPCGACEKVFYSKFRLSIHQRSVHMKEKNVSCPQCDAKFFTEKYLKCHMVKHGVVEKTYQCEYCKKTFPRARTLQSHIRIHTGDKRKVCKLCGKAFVQRASLKYHMTRYHPGAADA